MNERGPIADALRRAQAALHSLPVAAAQCSAEMRYLWVSQRYADWLGVPGDQVAGRPLAEVLGAAYLASMRPHIEVALAGKPIEREAEVLHKSLGPRWVHVDCTPTFSASHIPDGWIEVISDVTERRRTEDTLRENQGILQSFYDSSPFFMGVAELDDESLVLLYCNRALADALGTTPTQIAGRRADEIGTRDEARLWVQAYRQCRSQGAPVQFEYEHPTPSGNRWLRATVAFIGEGSHGRPRFSFVAEEITEQKKILEALREANRSKDEFLAMLGHELRNPLAPIATALQILTRRGDRSDAKTLAIVERQVQYLIGLVDDLLDVSRITRGKIQIKKRLLRLQDVVAEGLEMAMPLVEERHQYLDVRLPPSELRVNGDAGRLAQVVANLLTNSAKYTGLGGRITVQAYREGDQIVLTVRDTGIGIAPELLPHVFDMFTQERQSADRARGGLGIGLTIVRNLVELHGGTVQAESKGIGAGSLFTVRLPAETQEPAATEPASPAAPFAASAARRILVVDDNEDALDLLAELLRSAGHVVRTAKDGPSALAALDDFRPDVAILDIGLPVMDGYELAGRIRAELGEASPRLIALTGYGQASDRARTRAAGFALHLTKPVDVGCLLAALDPPRRAEDVGRDVVTS